MTIVPPSDFYTGPDPSSQPAYIVGSRAPIAIVNGNIVAYNDQLSRILKISTDPLMPEDSDNNLVTEKVVKSAIGAVSLPPPIYPVINDTNNLFLRNELGETITEISTTASAVNPTRTLATVSSISSLHVAPVEFTGGTNNLTLSNPGTHWAVDRPTYAPTLYTDNFQIGDVGTNIVIAAENTNAPQLVNISYAPPMTWSQTFQIILGGTLNNFETEYNGSPAPCVILKDVYVVAGKRPQGNIVAVSNSQTAISGGTTAQRWRYTFTESPHFNPGDKCAYTITTQTACLVAFSPATPYPYGDAWLGEDKYATDDYWFKVNVDTSAPIITEISTDPLLPTNSNQIIPTQLAIKEFVRYNDLIRSTGLQEGGDLSINADPTKFNISAGVAWKVDRVHNTKVKFSWTAFTGVTPTYLNTYAGSWISLNWDGATTTIIQTIDRPKPEERHEWVLIGRLSHFGLVTVTGTFMLPVMCYENDDTVDLGLSLNIIASEGFNISTVGPNLQIQYSEGIFYRKGGNYETDHYQPNICTVPAQNPMSFRKVYNAFPDDNIILSSPTTILDPDKFDLGDGTLATPGPLKYTNQFVIMFPYNNTMTIFVMYGQTQYNSYQDALNGITDILKINSPARQGIIKAVITLREDTTDLPAAIALNRAKIIMFNKIGRQ